jgi:phosphoribosylglycinamide formyltransferase-1
VTHLAVLASGQGSNARNIVRFFEGHPSVRVVCLLSDNPEAPALGVAAEAGIPAGVFSKAQWREGREPLDFLAAHHAHLLVLAGFLSLVPEKLLSAYPRRIINIHPALLPRFGGKGMYGLHVHKAVLAAGSAESGVTVHFVNDRYDEGETVFQEKIPVAPDETPQSLQAKIRALEFAHYPRVIERLAESISGGEGTGRASKAASGGR